MQKENNPKLWKRPNKDGFAYYVLIRSTGKVQGSPRLIVPKQRPKMLAEPTNAIRFIDLAKPNEEQELLG